VPNELAWRWKAEGGHDEAKDLYRSHVVAKAVYGVGNGHGRNHLDRCAAEKDIRDHGIYMDRPGAWFGTASCRARQSLHDVGEGACPERASGGVRVEEEDRARRDHERRDPVHGARGEVPDAEARGCDISYHRRERLRETGRGVDGCDVSRASRRNRHWVHGDVAGTGGDGEERRRRGWWSDGLGRREHRDQRDNILFRSARGDRAAAWGLSSPWRAKKV